MELTSLVRIGDADPRTGNLIVVKVMKRHLLVGLDRTMFEREVEILVSQNHPTVLAFCGYVTPNNEDGKPAAMLTE